MDKNNKIFIAGSLANGACFSMILPLLAPLIRQMKMSEWQAGALVSAGALLMAIAAIYIAKQQNKFSIYGLLWIGFVGMTLTWGLFTGVLGLGLVGYFTPTVLFILLLLARASTGVFMAMPQIALQTYVMTCYSDEKKRAQGMSKFGALNSLGLIVGPLLTTLLLAWGILTPLCFALIVFAGLSAYIIFGFDHDPVSLQDQICPVISDPQFNAHSAIHSTQQIQPNTQLNFSSTTESALQSEDLAVANPTAEPNEFSLRKSIIWFVLGFGIYMAIVTLNLTAGFYIQDQFQLSSQHSAIYFSQCSLIVGVTLVLMQIAISKYLAWTLHTLLWVGLSAMLLGLCVTFTAQSILVFQLAYVPYGVSVACLIPAFTTGAAQSAPQHLQAKVASLCTATQALSFVFAPLISTVLYQWHKLAPYVLLMLIMVLFMLYFLIQKRYTNKNIKLA